MTTQTDAVLKDPALREYYEALFEMFATPGWRMLMEDVGQMHALNDKTAGLETEAQLQFRKGELSQMEWLINRARDVEYAYNAILSEQESTPEAAPSGGKAKVVS